MLKLREKVRQVQHGNKLTSRFDYKDKPLDNRIACPGYNLDGERNDPVGDSPCDIREHGHTSAIQKTSNSPTKNKKSTSPSKKNQDIYGSGDHLQEYSEELEQKLQQVNEQADVGSNILDGTMSLIQSEITRKLNVQAAKDAMTEEEFKAVELREATMAELKRKDHKAWEYEPSGELYLKRYPEMPHSYFNQQPEDAFKVVTSSQYRYHNQIRIQEEKMMDNRILKTYFESIFKPMKFGNDQDEEFQLGYQDDYMEQANGRKKRNRPSDEQLLDIEQMGIQNRAQLTALFRAIREVSQERQFGILRERMHAGLIKDYDEEDLDVAYVIYKRIVEQDIKNKIVPLDILKMSRDPETALENVVERKEALDTADMKPQDQTEDEQIAEQVGAEVSVFNGLERVDATTVRHIGFFKALNEGKDQKFLDDIRNFKIFEDDINKFLCDDQTPSALSKFNTRISLKNCTKCKQALPQDDDGKAWQSDDGMTDSIMSDEEDRKELKLMKAGKYNEQAKLDDLVQNNKKANSTFAGQDAKTIVMKIGDIIENIDQLSARADNIVMTRSEFLNCLREVTAQKLLAIKEAKDIFNARVKKLLRAQQYELKSQEMFGVNAAQEVFKKKGHEVRSLFQNEIGELLKEYRQLHELIRFYQKKLKTQCTELCQQEQIIAKLSNQVSVAMKGRFEACQEAREVVAQYPHYEDKSNPNEKAPDDYELDPINALLKEPFDFYGKEVRLNQTEQMRILTNAVVKEKNSEIRRLTDQQDFMQMQCEELYDLLKKSCDSEIKLKIKVHDFENQIKKLKERQKIELQNLDKKHKDLEYKLIQEIKRQHQELNNLKIYNKHDNTITARIAAVLDGQVKMYKENARRMRAVLRVPRLCKMYHDQVRQDQMDEFACLDKIYEAHYAVVQKELFYDDDDKMYDNLTQADKTLLARQPEYSPPKTEVEGSPTKGSTAKKGFIQTEVSANNFGQKFSVGACGGPFSSKQSTAIDQGHVSKSMPKMNNLNKHAINNRLMTQAATQRHKMFKEDNTLNTTFNLSYIKKQYKGLDMFLQRGYERKPNTKECYGELKDLKTIQPPVSQRQSIRNHSIHIVQSKPTPRAFQGGLTQRHNMSLNLNEDSQANQQFVNTNPILFSNPLNMTARYSDHPHGNLLSMSIASDVYSPNQMFGEANSKNLNNTPFNNDIINKSIEIVHKSSNHKNTDILGPAATNAGTSTANPLNKTGMSISLPNSSLFKETSRDHTKDKDINFTKYFEQNMNINQDKIFKNRPFFIQNQKSGNNGGLSSPGEMEKDSVMNSLPSVQRGPSELELVGNGVADRFGQNSVDFMYLNGKAANQTSVPNSRAHRTIDNKNHSFVLSPKMSVPVQASPKGKRGKGRNDWQAISQTQNEFKGQKFLKPQLPSLKKKKNQ